MLSEGDAERLREGDVLALGDTLALIEDDSDALGDKEAEGLSLTDRDADGERDELGEILALGEVEADAGPKAVMTLAKSRSRTAPVTVNSVPVPTAPLPVLPSKDTLFIRDKDQSVSVTAAPFLFCCNPILFSLFV